MNTLVFSPVAAECKSKQKALHWRLTKTKLKFQKISTDKVQTDKVQKTNPHKGRKNPHDEARTNCATVLDQSPVC